MAFLAALPLGLNAEPQPAVKSHETTWTGTIISVDARGNTFTAKRGLRDRTFILGEKCAISTLDRKAAALGDLRPGEEVEVRYQHLAGVRIVDRIAERALRYEGTVQSVDPQAKTVTMAEVPLYQPFRAPRTFHLAADGKVMLREGHDGTLADVQPGDRVSIIYNVPGGARVAYSIRERTSRIVGTVETVNLAARTVKAKATSGEQAFVLGNDCQVMLNGEKKGQLQDVMPGSKYRFTYQEANGVNVLERIAPVPEAQVAQTASAR